MTNTLLRLQKKIPDNLLEILKLVFEATNESKIPAFVVGATARDLIFEYVDDAKIYRATEDVDFGVAVGTWAEFDQLKTSLCATGQFRNDRKIDKRLWWKQGNDEMRIDLVPYGGIESTEGEIAFPPDGDFKMNMSGFASAYSASMNLEIKEDFTIKIASLAGLAMLKFIAYYDRPMERKRDVQDIWFIAENYMNADNDARLFDDDATDADLLTDEFRYETCGARLLGRDIAPLLDDKTRDIVLNILTEDADSQGIQRFADVIYSERLQDTKRYEVINEVLSELKLGLLERT
jgi:predicted nucleotidyltransferase